MNAEVGGWFRYPLHLLSEKQVAAFKTALTYSAPYGDKNIDLYKLEETSICLPRDWIRTNYPTLYAVATVAMVDDKIWEADKLPTSNHPSVADPEAQEHFYQDIWDALLNCDSVLAYAPTGTGKTVVALRIAGKLGRKTLVLVHTEELRDQWITQAQLHLGISIERIGIIQQDKCEIENKDIVISLLQTQARRDYDSSVYNSFGFVIVDECHKLSTEFFADVLPRYNARFRLGLSATPRRKDGSDVVLFNHLGPIRVVARNVPTPIKVLVKNYYTKRKLWGNDYQERLSCLVKDTERNELLVENIVDFYKHNRNILAVSHSVEHIEKLIQMCIDAGIPKQDIGQFTATKSKYDPTYTWKVTGKVITSKEERAAARKAKVVFATDNLVREGVDEPHWDFLVDLVPFWNATQRLGRVRRYLKNKLYPKCFTIRDMKCNFSNQMYQARVKEYIESEAEIIPL